MQLITKLAIEFKTSIQSLRKMSLSTEYLDDHRMMEKGIQVEEVELLQYAPPTVVAKEKNAVSVNCLYVQLLLTTSFLFLLYS